MFLAVSENDSSFIMIGWDMLSLMDGRGFSSKLFFTLKPQLRQTTYLRFPCLVKDNVTKDSVSISSNP